ncbi:MAG: hypothetical protein M1834_009564 [Cirrosporium novae-zelandiae]|nr:MAG: hypothetical protein M1834_009564 [Cirrosporium novae-zelandiae]
MEHQIHLSPEGAAPHAPTPAELEHRHTFHRRDSSDEEHNETSHENVRPRSSIDKKGSAEYSHIDIATGNLDVRLPHETAEHIEDVDFGGPRKGMHYEHQEREYLHGRKLIFAFCGWILSEFTTGMGGNMLAPALPIVASQFNALDRLGWVASAYYMTQCPCMLLFGQYLALFNSKYVLIVAIGFFMFGSLLSGAAHNIETLILGRAFTGIGAAGCWVSVQTLVAMLVELKNRPIILGLFGLQNAVSSTVGPILAGVFADNVSWRWCFLIVLPIGVITTLVNLWTLPSLPPFPLVESTQTWVDERFQKVTRGKWKYQTDGWMGRTALIDFPGFFIVTCSLICLLLAIQWGGSTYPWNSATVIGLFVGFGAIMTAFVLWEFNAIWPIMPPGTFKNRTVVGASSLALFTLMCNLFVAVDLPVLYEAARGVSSLNAGLQIIAFLLTVVVSQIIEGFIMSWTGNYFHWGYTSPIFLALGGGLLYTVDANTSSARLIGYQIIYGMGIGFTQNVAFLSVQVDNEPEAIPISIAIVSFAQLFGGMLGPTIASAILSNSLDIYLPRYAPNAPAQAVKGSVDAIWKLKGEMRKNVVKAYLKSLNNIYIAAVPIAGVIMMSALLIRNKNLKGRAAA